ncbi:MAG: DNA-binding protein [Lachnospiraceae bacterium]|nr:DNA-binding protein [Lachnospiraceae bacterium]MBQ6195920.1 DNA-binding protein [Lachnospiraceae bacterium]
MDKLGKESLLYDFYGELLTKRQQEIYENVRFGDLSLSEAAETYGISRQGIHDMIRRSESALEAYEEKLGLVQKFLDNRRDVGAIRTLAERIRTTQDLSLLNEISALAQRIEDR